MDHISIIAAIARNRGIGYKNRLLYWLPNDLKRFKALTNRHTIIIGRKTYESLPKGALPNRRNIVLSSDQALTLPGAEVCSSLQEALKSCKGEEEIYMIGGESLYRQAMEFADSLRLTEVEDTPKEADAFFPEIDPAIWKEISRESHPADEKHAYAYSFVDYIRR
ncbi:MAG: dihydrofolate reductase [Bacteroides sp.]|nr:dihydrofolate reductase [Bacteroides sp.]